MQPADGSAEPVCCYRESRYVICRLELGRPPKYFKFANRSALPRCSGGKKQLNCKRQEFVTQNIVIVRNDIKQRKKNQ